MRSFDNKIFLFVISVTFPLMVTGQILGSTILTTQQQANSFMNLVGLPLNTSMINLYRATRDGFSKSAFRSLVNGMNGTYTIIKSNNGWIFGGYTKIDWGLNIGWVSDSSAFIFSLVNPYYYPCIMYQKNNASLHTVYTGGGFQMGLDPDIKIEDSSNTNAYSVARVLNFQVPSNYTSFGSEFLTGYVSLLTAEIEVYTSNNFIKNIPTNLIM